MMRFSFIERLVSASVCVMIEDKNIFSIMRMILIRFVSFGASINITISVLICFILIAIFKMVSLTVNLHHIKLYSILYQSIGLHDLLNSAYLKILIGVFALNLLACMLSRIPATLKMLFSKNTPGASKRLPQREAFQLEQGATICEQTICSIIRKACARPKSTTTDTGTVISSEKGRYALSGFYLAHVGLLIILISIYGYRPEKINIYIYRTEGETISSIFYTQNKLLKEYKLDKEILIEKLEHVEMKRKNTPPFRSILAINVNGKPDMHETIHGYESFKYKDLIITHKKTHPATGAAHVSLAITPKSANGRKRAYRVKEGEVFTVSETGDSIRVYNILHDVEKKQVNGLALQVFDTNKSLLYRGHIKNPLATGTVPKDNKIPEWHEHYEMAITGYDVNDNSVYAQYSIVVDPQANLFWYGMLFTIAGFAVIYLCYYRKIVVSIEKQGDTCRISMAGIDNRNMAAIHEAFHQIKSACGLKEI